MKSSLIQVSPILLAASVAAASAQGSRGPAAPPSQAAAPTSAQRPRAVPAALDKDAAEEYRINPGDVLQVFVWREPELTREVRVRPDGHLTVPLLGDVDAASKTPRSLADELAQALGRFVNAPNVTVTVTYSSRLRFFVIGQVTKPGEFPLLGHTTVLQALALAGGFVQFAKTDEIRIIRQDPTTEREPRARAREIVLSVNYKSIAQGQGLQQNHVLRPGDVIVVP